MDIRIRDPLIVNLVLKRALSSLKMYRQMQRKNEIEQGDYESKQTNIPVASRKQQKCTRQRNEGDQRKHRVVQRGAHRVPIQTMYAITTAAPAAIHPA